MSDTGKHVVVPLERRRSCVLGSSALFARPLSSLEIVFELIALAAVTRVPPEPANREEADVDEGLLRRITAGDEDALAALYDRRIRLVFSLASRILDRQTEAEEIAQDVFTYVWRHAGQFDRRRGTVAAWLLILTRSRSLDRLRARRVRPDAAQPVDDRALEQLPARAEDYERRLISEGDAARLRAALLALTPAEREPIELAYYGGLSQREIAERLGQPLGTIKTRVRTGLLRLRSALAPAAS